MNLNQPLLLIQISVHGCSYTALCMLLLFSRIMLQMHNEGVYIPFPSCALETVYSRIKILSTCINYFKCLLPTKDESNPLKVHLHYTNVPHLNGSFKICATIPKCFQNLCWRSSNCLLPSVLARLMWEMLLHQKVHSWNR
jgi:hypothetical protein